MSVSVFSRRRRVTFMFILLKRKHKRRRIRISDLNGSKTYLTFPSRYKYCYMNNQYVEGKVIYYHQVWEKWKKC
jgi:hypothetical protein